MDIFILRMIERIAIVVGAVIFAYLGYKLFLFGIKEGHSKLQSESKFFKITFSGTGPGLFFMAFGSIVLIITLFTGDVFQIKPSTTTVRGSITGTGDPSRIDPETASEAVKRGKDFAVGGKAIVTRSGQLLSDINRPPPTLKVESIKQGLKSEDPSVRIESLNRVLELDRDQLLYVYGMVEDIFKNDKNEEVRKAANDVLNKL